MCNTFTDNLYNEPSAYGEPVLKYIEFKFPTT